MMLFLFILRFMLIQPAKYNKCVCICKKALAFWCHDFHSRVFSCGVFSSAVIFWPPCIVRPAGAAAGRACVHVPCRRRRRRVISDDFHWLIRTILIIAGRVYTCCDYRVVD